MNHVNGDPIPCPGCGYAVCSCPEDDGWRLAYDEDGFTSYVHDDGAIVWTSPKEPWCWDYKDGDAALCSLEDAKPTKAEAMAAALELYAREELSLGR